MDQASTTQNFNVKKPRKIKKIKQSKYEVAEAIHANKMYWSQIFNKVDGFSLEAINESRRIAEVLPFDLYKKVCSTLDIPITTFVTETAEHDIGKTSRRMVKEPMISFRKSLYIDKELDSDTDVEINSSDDEDKPNIHQDFLMKPEREQVTWPSRYLQPEREDEKSLVKKADDLTDRIVQNFCNYMKELGGDQQSNLFTPSSIKELFQIEFDTHVARSLRVISKELFTVEEKIANVTSNPEKSQYAALEREVAKDIRAERKPKYTTAFGRSVPLHEQWRTPQNNTKKLWRSARHVPKDLVTLKTVWEGITNLRSVKEYCRWMIDHPEYRRAPYLKSVGMFDSAVLETRLTFEAQERFSPLQAASGADASPAPIDQIRRRLSELADSI